MKQTQSTDSSITNLQSLEHGGTVQLDLCVMTVLVLTWLATLLIKC